MAGDDLLEGVQEEILPFGVLGDLREDEGGGGSSGGFQRTHSLHGGNTK